MSKLFKLPDGFRVRLNDDSIEVKLSDDEAKSLIQSVIHYMGNFVTVSDEGREWLSPVMDITDRQESVERIVAANPNLVWVERGVSNQSKKTVVLDCKVKGTQGQIVLTALVYQSGEFTISRRNMYDSFDISYPTLDDLTAGSF